MAGEDNELEADETEVAGAVRDGEFNVEEINDENGQGLLFRNSQGLEVRSYDDKQIVDLPDNGGRVVYNDGVMSASIAGENGRADISYKKYDNSYLPSEIAVYGAEGDEPVGRVFYDENGQVERIVDKEWRQVKFEQANGENRQRISVIDGNGRAIDNNSQEYTSVLDNFGQLSAAAKGYSDRAVPVVTEANQAIVEQKAVMDAYDEANAQAKLEQLRENVAAKGYTDDEMMALDYQVRREYGDAVRDRSREVGHLLSKTERAELYCENFEAAEMQYPAGSRERKNMVRQYRKEVNKINNIYQKYYKASEDERDELAEKAWNTNPVIGGQLYTIRQLQSQQAAETQQQQAVAEPVVEQEVQRQNTAEPMMAHDVAEQNVKTAGVQTETAGTPLYFDRDGLHLTFRVMNERAFMNPWFESFRHPNQDLFEGHLAKRDMEKETAERDMLQATTINRYKGAEM